MTHLDCLTAYTGNAQSWVLAQRHLLCYSPEVMQSNLARGFWKSRAADDQRSMWIGYLDRDPLSGGRKQEEEAGVVWAASRTRQAFVGARWVAPGGGCVS